MAIRIEEAEVWQILPADADTTVNLSPFIKAASQLVDRVSARASATGSNVSVSDDELKEIERWLTAHLFCIRDRLPSERKIGDATDKYQGKTDMGLDATTYGQQAKMLDPTGELARLASNKKPFVMETINPISDVYQ